jgi:hypothetical protein
VEYAPFVDDLKTYLRDECSEFSKRFENFEYWVPRFAGGIGIATEPMDAFDARH